MSKAIARDTAKTGFGASASRRDERLFAEAVRHSRRVRLLKVAIPLVAVIMTAMFAGATLLRPAGGMSVEGISMSNGRIVMAAPKLDGVTKENKPYRMQAERALQNVKTGEIELETITASFPFTAGANGTLNAKAGLYDNNKRTLQLSDGIVLKTTNGMVANMQSADIDMNSQHLSTDRPVDITTSQARLTAESMTVIEGGKQLVFERKVRMTINPSVLGKTNEQGN